MTRSSGVQILIPVGDETSDTLEAVQGALGEAEHVGFDGVTPRLIRATMPTREQALEAVERLRALAVVVATDDVGPTVDEWSWSS